MNFDQSYDGPEEFTASDRLYAGSRFSEVRAALFANPYYRTWGGPGESPLPVYEVTLGRALRGILSFGKGWHYLQAARRTLASQADLRWGPDGRGFRRIVHPNGVCLTGTWEIDDAPEGTAVQWLLQARQPGPDRRPIFHVLHGDAKRALSIPRHGRKALSDHRPGSCPAISDREFLHPGRPGWGIEPDDQ